MTTTDVRTLPFMAAIKLYNLKIHADKNNNIKLRTKLLKHYPTLFDKEILKMFEMTVENARNYNIKKYLNSKNDKYYKVN